MLGLPETEGPYVKGDSWTTWNMKLGEREGFRPGREHLREVLLHICSEGAVLKNGPVCDTLSPPPPLSPQHAESLEDSGECSLLSDRQRECRCPHTVRRLTVHVPDQPSRPSPERH